MASRARGRDRLGERRLRPRAAVADLGAREPLGAHALDELFELVDLGAREVGRLAGTTQRLDDLRRADRAGRRRS